MRIQRRNRAVKSKPVVMENFYTVHTSFIIDFHFTNNTTILTGKAGVGKIVVY